MEEPEKEKPEEEKPEEEDEEEEGSNYTEIPGSYGSRCFGALKDRLDFFWFQGEAKFWASRMEKYGSTVFRVNMPPSPPGFPATRAIMLLDQKTYPILFDTTKVEKKDILLGNYMPSLAFYGGVRPCVFLDPTEERHGKLKSYFLELLHERAERWAPEVESACATDVFPAWERELQRKRSWGKKQKQVAVNEHTARLACDVLLRVMLGGHDLGRWGPICFLAWIGPQVAPVASVGLRPRVVEELLLHTLPIPAILVSCFRRRLVSHFREHGAELVERGAAEPYRLDRREVLQNLVFLVGFNAFGGLNLFLPTLLGHVGRAGRGVQEAMAAEVRAAVGGRRLTAAAIGRMELLRSAVLESLRLAPPVPYQFARARRDLVLHAPAGARYKVKKGEIVGGCQAVAGRDAAVFDDPDTFIAHRFMGDEGRALMKHVLWSNGPGDARASAANKQCAAVDLVPFLAQAFLASLFLRYDSFTALPPVVRGSNVTVCINSLNSRSDYDGGGGGAV